MTSVLTVEMIEQAAAQLRALPKIPQLFSYSLWPDGDATVVEHEEGRRIVANPAFWSRYFAAAHTLLHAEGVRVIDLDLDANRALRVDVMLDLAKRLARHGEAA